MASLFEKIFKPGKNLIDSYNTQTQFQLMNSFIPAFHSIENPYDSPTVRKAIHTIATNGAKLKGKHIRRTSSDIVPQESNLDYLLNVRPNYFMSAFDFQYKVITNLLLNNNVFIYIDRDEKGNVMGFHPLSTGNFIILEYQAELYIKFQFGNGRTFTSHYDNFIHLRRYYNGNDLFGESNALINDKVNVIKTSDDSIVNAVKQSAFLRGLLKFNTMLKPDDMKRERDRFISDYMNVSDATGVAALDSKAEYIELKNNPQMTNRDQMKFLEEDMLSYFNINPKIVNSSYTEDEWNAFYESVLEPISLQMSQEFTYKVFTRNEISYGNEIMFEPNRLQYASIKTKIALVQYLAPLAVLSKNEVREIFNMSKIEGGDVFLQTLNVVDSSKANQYQGVDDNDLLKGGETDEQSNSDSKE